MVGKSLLTALAVAALALAPTFALAEDATFKKGSLEAAGSGSSAPTVQQAQDSSDGEFEGALIALPFLAGGGAAAAVLLGDGDGGGDGTTTATQTAE